MTRTRYRIYESEYPYFMTCTTVGWVSVFTRPDAVQILFDSWRFLLEQRQFRLYGYVVLENHIHLIASAPELANAMKSFKMYTASQIVDLLESHGAKLLLQQFRALKLRHKTASEYQIWQEGYQPKQITSNEMMLQKLEYIHMNPVKRGYVDDPSLGTKENLSPSCRILKVHSSAIGLPTPFRSTEKACHPVV